MTYYIILSFFPLLIFLLTLAGYAQVTSQQLFENIRYLFPEQTYRLVENIVYEILATRSPTLLSFGMLGAIWTSHNGISALIRGIVKAYGLTDKRSYFRMEALSFSLLLLICVVLIFILSTILLLDVKGGPFFQTTVFSQSSIFLRQAIRFVIQIIFLIGAVMLLNRLAAGRKYPWRMVFPGSLFTAAGWLVLSQGFSVYFRHYDQYTMTYGSIGGIMVLLLWLYWGTEILLLGSALNAVLIENKRIIKPELK